MPKGVPIPQKAKELIYTAHCLNESAEDIAERTGISVVTVRKIIREQRKAQEEARAEMSKSAKVVKKDGNGGKLMAISPSGFEFTHVTPDGKSHRTKVEGHISRVAERQYDAWCQKLDDECEFMRKVERKADYLEQEAVAEDTETEAVEVEEEPVEDDYLTELQNRVAELEEELAQSCEQVERLEAELAKTRDDEVNAKAVAAPSNDVVAKTELDEPKLSSWFNGNGGFRVVWDRKPVYLLWAKSEKARPYGVYATMDAALKKLDELNDVAAFLGNESAFEVEEVAWK